MLKTWHPVNNLEAPNRQKKVLSIHIVQQKWRENKMKGKYLPVAALTLLFVLVMCSIAHCGTISLISTGLDGKAAGTGSWGKLSSNGRFFVFDSSAANLTSDDTNGVQDIFVRDIVTGKTTRISVSSTGVQANIMSQTPAISADGRYVVFETGATNLLPGDTNAHSEIYMHDMLTGENRRVSLASDGTQPNGWCFDPVISPDGRYVAFFSWATNLVKGLSRNNYSGSCYVHDMVTGSTKITPWGFFPSLSGPYVDGNQYAVFKGNDNTLPGDANGLVDIFAANLITGVTELISIPYNSGQSSGGDSSSPSISEDGRYVAFVSDATNLVESDTNGVQDIFVRDREAVPPTTIKVSVDLPAVADLSIGTPSMSADGRYVVFQTSSSSLWRQDVYVVDWKAGISTLLDIPITWIRDDVLRVNNPSTNRDGRYVSFRSNASSLDPNVIDENNDYDVFIYDTGVGEPLPTVGAPPSNGTVSTTSSTWVVGNKLTYTTTYSDADGFDDIAYCFAVVNPTLSETNSVWLIYDNTSNKLYMKNDAGTGWIGGITPGTASTLIQNSQCIVYCGETIVEKSGNQLTVNWKIAFKSPMAGKICNSWLKVTDNDYLTDEWKDVEVSLTIQPAPKKK